MAGWAEAIAASNIRRSSALGDVVMKRSLPPFSQSTQVGSKFAGSSSTQTVTEWC
jgi:hypothetical protein